jgi:carbon-monoxide dehydrogenase medium subunit
MKPAPFDYVAPTTVDEAVEHLARAAGDATILAGGQTLMPLLALRMSTPSVIVDINRIDALKGMSRTDEAMRVGAMMRQYEVVESEPLKAALPMLAKAVSHIGHHQTRNRGTVGGSVSLGEPAAELPACVVALGASIEARSARGTRRIAADEFYLGAYSTVLEPDELVTAIHFPHWRTGTRTLFCEVARRPGDFALVGLVGALTVESGKISRAGIAWFGMAATPIKARRAEEALINQPITALDAAAVADLALADTDPFDDHAATADYRRTVALRVFSRSLRETMRQEA